MTRRITTSESKQPKSSLRKSTLAEESTTTSKKQPADTTLPTPSSTYKQMMAKLTYSSNTPKERQTLSATKLKKNPSQRANLSHQTEMGAITQNGGE